MEKSRSNCEDKMQLGQQDHCEKIITKEQQNKKDFGACCMTLNASWNKHFFESQWWNEHNHVVIDAKGQNKNRHFLHLEELMYHGCSKTVFHKQETVEEMMNQKSDEKPAAKTETVGNPPIVWLLWTRKRTTSLEVLEMPCGEHDNASIANLLANFFGKTWSEEKVPSIVGAMREQQGM